MIRSLRARHRGIFVALALTLPAGFAAALIGRRAPTASALAAAPARFGREVRWPQYELVLGLRYDFERRLEVHVAGTNAPPAPSPLLYWSPVAPDGEGLPPGARLMGALAEGPCEFGLDAVEPRGWLVLYSLGHAEVLGHLPLILEQEL